MEYFRKRNYAEIIDDLGNSRRTEGSSNRSKRILHFCAWVRFLYFSCRLSSATSVKSHNGGRKVLENVHEMCCSAFEGLQVRYIWNALYTAGFKTGWEKRPTGETRDGVREEPVRSPSFFFFPCTFAVSLSRLSFSLCLSTFFSPLFFLSSISFPAQYTERAHRRTLIVGSRHQHTWSYGKSILALHFGGNTRVRFVPLDEPSSPFPLPSFSRWLYFVRVRSETTRSCWDNHNEDIFSMQKARRHSAFRIANVLWRCCCD